MRVIHFSVDDDPNPVNYLAIQHRETDSDVKIPVYKEESDGVYRVTSIFFPACTKFMYGLTVKFDKHMTAEEVRREFGEIDAP